MRQLLAHRGSRAGWDGRRRLDGASFSAVHWLAAHDEREGRTRPQAPPLRSRSMASPGGSSSASDGEAEGSVLGTHAHWAAAYAAELAEFEASAGADQGEVWFGEDTQGTMVRFITALVDAEAAAATPGEGGEAPSAAAQSPEAARAAWRVLDLGCGNGALCVALARAGCVAKRAFHCICDARRL